MPRVDTSPRVKNAARPKEKSVPGFGQWLRGRPCHLATHRKGGCGLAEFPRRTPVEAAHVDHAGDKGAGTKVSDRHMIPLCQAHHDEQGGKTGPFRERGGWPTFEAKYGFNAVEVAAEYWRKWPKRAEWERSL